MLTHVIYTTTKFLCEFRKSNRTSVKSVISKKAQKERKYIPEIFNEYKKVT